MLRLLFVWMIVAGPLAAMEVVWTGEAQPGIAVTVSCSEKSVWVDSLLQVDIDVVYPEGYIINKALLRSNLMDYLGYGITPFTLVSEETFIINSGHDKITYLLDPDIPGHYAMTFRDIVFDSAEGKKPVKLLSGVFDVEVTMEKELVVADGIPFGVLPLTVDPPIVVNAQVRAKFLDNPVWWAWVRMMDWREFQASIFPWRGLVAAAVMLALAGAGYLYAWSRGRRRGEPAVPRLTAAERALRAIEEISARGLPQQGEYEAYYVALTTVVRRYLEERYGVHAETLTTEEFLLEAVRHPDLDVHERELLEEFLECADRVKFAQHRPTGLECAEAEKAAMAFCL